MTRYTYSERRKLRRRRTSPTTEEQDMTVNNELRALRAIVAVVKRMSPASRRWLIARLTADA